MVTTRRVLLNAEPFGFGPAAAIACIAQGLADADVELGYIGENHTLDLQKNQPYSELYDITGQSPEERAEMLSKIAPSYDLFLTAMDFGMAELAMRAGMKVAIYDALCWYWKSLPPAITQADLYLAQDFVGVKERIEQSPQSFKNARVVPPIVTKQERSLNPKHVLINLGGLQNPLWDIAGTTRYAKTVIESITKDSDLSFVISTSSAVAAELSNPLCKSYDRQSMQLILADTKFAFMTPGLGNIYDAAAYGIPTIWLPPANDSQGQQLKLLASEGLLDEYVDWSDISSPIDYRDDQPRVLEEIAGALASDSVAEPLARLMKEKTGRVENLSGSKTSRLLTMFGEDGTSKIVDAIVEFLEAER